MALGPAVFDHHIAAFDEAGFFQSLQEWGGSRREAGPREMQIADDRRCRLLRAGCRLQAGGSTTQQRDELASFHSITSSASASSVAGTVRPSARAVFRLITSSNRVGCTTGRSAGLASLRILPT